jgi:hypothetical protein
MRHVCRIRTIPRQWVKKGGERFQALGRGIDIGDGAGDAAVRHQALLQFPERVSEYSLADQGLTE